MSFVIAIHMAAAALPWLLLPIWNWISPPEQDGHAFRRDMATIASGGLMLLMVVGFAADEIMKKL